METKHEPPTDSPEEIPLWSTGRAARELDVSERTVTRMAERGDLTSYDGQGWDPIEVTNLARRRQGKQEVKLRIVSGDDPDEPAASDEKPPSATPDFAELFRAATAALKEQMAANRELIALVVDPVRHQNEAWIEISKSQALRLKELEGSRDDLLKARESLALERAEQTTEKQIVLGRENQRDMLVKGLLANAPALLARLMPPPAPAAPGAPPPLATRDAALVELATTLDEELIEKLTPRQKELLDGIVASFLEPPKP